MAKAPTFSDTMSPELVRIDHAVSAMASPPTDETSLKVMRGRPVLDGCLRQLAGGHLDIGANDGVERAIGRDDVIGAGIEPDDRVGRDILHDETPLAIVLHVIGIDGEFQVLVGNLRVVAGDRVEHNAARIKNQFLIGNVAARRHGNALRRRGAAKGGVEEVFAGGEAKAVRSAIEGGYQLQLAILSGNGGKYVPGNAALHCGAIGCELCIAAHDAAVLWDRRRFWVRREAVDPR